MVDHPGFSFEITRRATSSRARLGRLTTPHGTIETPAFVFCATKGSVRGVTPRQLTECDAQIILGNTYHLMLRPGAELVAEMGGLHRFLGWNGPMLTDSGGFQIFSLGGGTMGGEIKSGASAARPKTLLKIDEEGAEFRSYIDGSRHRLTPESAIQVQRQLGADLVLTLDECTPHHVDREYTARSMEMTHRWADRSLAEFDRGEGAGSAGPQALYGIIQGGVYEDLRHASSEFVNSRPFFGQAVGGCLGTCWEEFREVVHIGTARIDPSRPTHLLGVGGVVDIWESVALGVDTFDCVSPTRVARHGHALVRTEADGKLNLRNARFRDDKEPIEAECGGYCCTDFSRAYIHHLLKAGEFLAGQLLSLHNIRFMTRLMTAVRAAIADDRVADARKDWVAG